MKNRRIFAIEWSEDLGPMWMNEDNLMIVLQMYGVYEAHKLVVEDVTDELALHKESPILRRIVEGEPS